MKQNTEGEKGHESSLDLLIMNVKSVDKRAACFVYMAWLVSGVQHPLCGSVRILQGTLNWVMQIKWFPMTGPLKHVAHYTTLLLHPSLFLLITLGSVICFSTFYLNLDITRCVAAEKIFDSHEGLCSIISRYWSSSVENGLDLYVRDHLKETATAACFSLEPSVPANVLWN